MSDSQSNMMQFINSPTIIKTYLSYSVSNHYEIEVIASNHVSKVSKTFTVEVVRKWSLHKTTFCIATLSILGTNTTLILEFSVQKLSQDNVNYKDPSWRKQFADKIDEHLTNVCL